MVQRKKPGPLKKPSKANGTRVRELEERIQELERERDHYLKALYLFIEKHFYLDRKDIREMQLSGITLQSIIEEFERDCKT